MSIPFDLAKKIILDICAGASIEQASEETGFSVAIIEQFFRDEVHYTYEQFASAEGISGPCMAPYYTEIFPVKLNHDVRSVIANAIDTFGNVLKDARIEHNERGLFVNDALMNAVAFHTFDAANPLGVLYVSVNGFYRDESNVLHELDVYHAEPVTEDNYHLYGADYIAVTGQHEAVARNAFKNIFKAVNNDYRL
jgi:hypothetical protein